MRTVYIFLFLLISSFTYAQKIEIGEIKTLQSAQLKEKREYWIYLPNHYSDEKYKSQKFPVIYLLDGEKYFHVISGIVENLSAGYYPQMPECIVVGIKNSNRSRDLTPTADSSYNYTSGGAKEFENFITLELLPEINKNYRTLNYNMLFGHSFGGLFTINTLLNKPKSFNAYIAIDPSLWWDDKFVIKEADSLLSSINFNKRTLFFAKANSIKDQIKPSKQHIEAQI